MFWLCSLLVTNNKHGYRAVAVFADGITLSRGVKVAARTNNEQVFVNLQNAERALSMVLSNQTELAALSSLLGSMVNSAAKSYSHEVIKDALDVADRIVDNNTSVIPMPIIVVRSELRNALKYNNSQGKV